MYEVKQDSTLVGLSELRANPDAVIKAAQKGRVILQKRNHPVAAIISFELLEVLEKLTEFLEDQSLAKEAHKRSKSAKRSDYLSHEEVKKRLGI